MLDLEMYVEYLSDITMEPCVIFYVIIGSMVSFFLSWTGNSLKRPESLSLIPNTIMGFLGLLPWVALFLAPKCTSSISQQPFSLNMGKYSLKYLANKFLFRKESSKFNISR